MSHSKEFLTPPCTVFAARLDSMVPGTSLYWLKATFVDQHATAMRADTRQQLMRMFGRLAAARACETLHDLGDGRWLLDLVSSTMPTICDHLGRRCIGGALPSGSVIRVRGCYAPMPFPCLMPVMAAIQIGRLADDDATPLFDPFDLAA